MTRSKKMITLTAVLLGIILIYAVLNIFGGEKKEDTIAVTNIDVSDIEKIAWNYNDENIAVERKDDKWIIPGEETFPVNQAKINEMAEMLGELKANQKVDGDEDYGLEGNIPTIFVTLKKGEEKTFTLGDVNEILGKCYISYEDNVYLVDNSFKISFECDKDSLLQMENIPYLSDANNISITKDGVNMTLVATENKGETQWKSGEVILDTNKVENLKIGLNSLAWKECVDYNADDAKIAEYGLNTPNVIIKWGNDTETIEIEVVKNIQSGELYARIKDSNMIYTIDSSFEEYFITDHNTLVAEITKEDTAEME